MWGSSTRTLAMVDSARAAGTDAMIDQYPYTASYTGIGILIPAWAMAGGNTVLLTRMNDPGVGPVPSKTPSRVIEILTGRPLFLLSSATTGST